MEQTKTTIDTNTPHHSAAKLMSTAYITSSKGELVGEVRNRLMRSKTAYVTTNCLLVVDKKTAYVGVVSLSDLFQAPPESSIETLITDFPIIHPNTDQERIAYLALEHSVPILPVVDKLGNLLGIIDEKTILSVTYWELEEDLMRFSGVLSHRKNRTRAVDDIINTPLKASVIHRLPWLILGLVGGIAAAKIVEVFEVTLSQNIILAAFIPLIVYMGDAVGTQMEAFIIRDLSLNPKLSILKYFSKQLMVVLSLGIISAIMVYLTTMLIYGTSTIAAILSISMFFAILSSVITGLFVPYIFGKMNFDPANASGPIATILQDLMSVSIYFAAAHILLQM